MQSDFDLNLYDYSARNYDPLLGRTTTIDPHSETYYSLSSYSYFANNPLLFVDPTGKDLLFYVWEYSSEDQFGTTMKRRKVQFSDLDEKTQKALEAFAKTDEGNSYFAKFAKAGDKVGSVEFGEDGKLSDHDIGVSARADPDAGWAGANGITLTKQNGKNRLSFNIILNTETISYDNNVESLSLTLGHETFIHLDQYAEALVEAARKNDVKAINEIYREKRKNANDDNGGPDHNAYINNGPSMVRMKNYIQQLRSILNPEKVDKAVKIHDDKFKIKK